MVTTEHVIQVELSCDAAPTPRTTVFGLHGTNGELTAGSAEPEGSLTFRGEIRAVTMADGTVRFRGQIVHVPLIDGWQRID